MKMIYLFNHTVIENEHIGIRKKMQMQLKAFKELGYEPIYIVFDDYRICIQQISSRNKTIIKYYPTTMSVYNAVIDFIENEDIEFIYMRYSYINNHLLFDLYRRLGNMNLPFICEFFTWPYDKEFDTETIQIRMDKYYRGYLKEYVDFSTNYNCYNEILGIKSIPIVNGVDTNIVKIKKSLSKNTKRIDMIAVALMYKWHGYDRVIKGMNEYYKDNNEYDIYLHLVGEGKETNMLKKMVRDYKLEEKVIFYGKITDNIILDQIFDNMDIAIGSVGMHRINLTEASPIKAAEYCARGIPFVIGYNDISFDKNYPYILKVNPNDENIDMCSIISFYKKVVSCEVTLMMRKYAEDNLTWKSMMSKVIKTMKG